MSDSRTNQPVDLAEVLLRSADPFFFVDDAGIIRAWNFGAELLLGWTRDEALGAEVSIVLPEIPPGPPSEEEPEESLHDSVVAENFQTVFKAKDGHQIPVKITVTLIRDENGVLLGSGVNARNVAREKALEQELRWRIGEMEMLDNVARSVQSTLDIQRVLRIILTAFTAGSGLGFNRAILFLVSGSLLEARLGIGSSNWEEAGRMWPRVADKPDLQSVIDFVLAEDDTTPSVVHEIARDWRIPLEEAENPLIICMREKRSLIWPDSGDPGGSVAEKLRSPMFAAVPLLHGGRAIGAVLADNVVTGRPIDEHAVRLLRLMAGSAASAISNARLYEEVTRHAQNLEKASEQIKEQQDLLLQSRHFASLGRIVAAINHEVQGPLVPIGGFARALRREVVDGSPQAEKLDFIIKEVARLENVVKGVASLAAVPLPTLHPVLLSALVEKVYTVVRADAGARGVILESDIPPDVPPPHIDHDQWYQALLVLVSKAVEVTPDGGTVSTSLRAEHGRYVIRVSDSGPGIPQNQISKAFGPFFSTQPSLEAAGLNVVAEIVRRHFGRVSVQSSATGTTVAVDFPMADELYRLVEKQRADESNEDRIGLLDPLTQEVLSSASLANGN